MEADQGGGGEAGGKGQGGGGAGAQGAGQGWKRRRIYTRNVYIHVPYRENTIQYVSSGVAADWHQMRVPPQSKQMLPRINGANVRYFIEFAMNLI